MVKKAVKARAGTLASEERLLSEVVAAFQASAGLPLALVKDPGGRDKGAGWRLAVTLDPGAPERLFRPLLRRIDRYETLGASKAELQEGPEPGVVTPKSSALPWLGHAGGLTCRIWTARTMPACVSRGC